MFGTTGCPEQFEKCMKIKHLNSHKSITKALNAFGFTLRVEKGFSALGSQTKVGPSSDSNQQ